MTIAKQASEISPRHPIRIGIHAGQKKPKGLTVLESQSSQDRRPYPWARIMKAVDERLYDARIRQNTQGLKGFCL